MFRKICMGFVFVLSTMTLGCSQEGPTPLVIPSEYQHAEEMLNHLKDEGLDIQEIHNSKYTAVFNTNPNYSMYLKTDMGIFELVHLERKNGKDIEVQEASNNGKYKYTVLENGEEQLLILGAENYFNKSDEYLTIARNKEINDKIKKALKAQES